MTTHHTYTAAIEVHSTEITGISVNYRHSVSPRRQ